MKPLALANKAFAFARNRPTQVYAVIRQFVLFGRTRFWGRLVFTRQNGIELGRNVRIQRLSCLSSERPGAWISVGADSIVYENARIEAYGKGRIEIGACSIIGDARIYSRALIRIGQRVVTSWNVFIQDFDPHPIEPELRAIQVLRMCGRASVGPQVLEWDFPVDAIVIGDDVWLGANVTVLKGAHIGDGCVVATGSVVTAGDYPARSILAGVPARVIKTLKESSKS